VKTDGNFIFIFAGLVILMAAEPYVQSFDSSGALMQLGFTTTLVVGSFSLTAHRIVFRVGIGLAAIALVTSVAYYATDSIAARLVDVAAIIAFCGLAVAISARYVILDSGPMTFNRIVGALCIYLLLGMIWAILFGVVELFDPEAFVYPGNGARDPGNNFFYYSFVTLTTLGYGDITPTSPFARTLAYLEATVGQLYLAVLVAGLVGRYVAEGRSKDPGASGRSRA